jgi:hypothetical protein
MAIQLLDRDIIIKALTRMGEIAKASGVSLEICLYGGTALMLAYDARTATKDVDAVLRPRTEGKVIASQVAREMGLPDNWLNDEVKIFLSNNEALIPLELKTGNPALYGIAIKRPTASYIFAMKCRACRLPRPGFKGDFDDLKFLIRKMEIRNIEQADAHVEKHFPRYELDDLKLSIISDLIREVWK